MRKVARHLAGVPARRPGIAIGAWALLALVGCDRANPRGPWPEPGYGPGVELQGTGQRVDIRHDGQLELRMRLSSGGVRVYDGSGERVGRLRYDEQGWVLEDREGSAQCTVPGVTLGLVMRCDEQPPVEVEYDAPGHIQIQRNGQPVAELLFEEGSGARMRYLPDGAEWVAREGSGELIIRSPEGAEWIAAPPHLAAPAALAVMLPPAAGAGDAGLLQRASLVWMVDRALALAEHGAESGSGTPVVEGSGAASGSGAPVVEGSGVESGSGTPAVEGSGVESGSGAPAVEGSGAESGSGAPVVEGSGAESGSGAPANPTAGAAAGSGGGADAGGPP